jgi:hypothetical protein
MCHDWWQWRLCQEHEESRELWDEFERTRPLTDPHPPDQEVEVTLESPEAERAGAER